MKRNIKSVFSGWSWIVLASAGLTSVGLPANQLRAQATATKPAEGKLKLETSGLSLAPSTAAYFSTSLNMREGWKEQLESGLIGELRQVPYIQQLEGFIQDKWDNPEPQTQQVKNFLSSPIARDIMLLFSDMAAQECFVVGDQNWTNFLKAFGRFQYETASLSGQDPEVMREHFLSLTKEDFDAIPIPTLVMGFQLSEDGNARTQLDAFEGILQLALANIDQLKPIAKQLKRKDLANGQTLSMTFLADDIPWDAIPVNDDSLQEVVDHVADMIAGRKIVLTIGVLDNRMLMSFSDSADTLVNLGKGANLLSIASMKQLRDNMPNDLRSVQYVSGEFRSASFEAQYGQYFERMALQITTPLAAQFDTDEFTQWQEKLMDDCEWLDEKLSEVMPKYAAMMAYAFQTPEGMESYSYDWTPNPAFVNAKPLGVASHGGASPLFLMAARQNWPKGLGEIVDGVMDELPKHLELLQDSGMMEDDQVEKLGLISEKVLPIVEELYAAIRDKIIPGLDGNESVMSITAQTMASQLSEDAPAPPAPLPLPEVGIAMKIKNKDLFLTGCDEVIRAINSIIDFAREQSPQDVPASARVPAPESETMAGGGTRYSFPMGAPAPWDQFELQMAVNTDVAVLGYSTRQVRDMYQTRPLAARPGWYADNEPIASVGFVDIAGMFKSMKPWVHYLLSNVNSDLEEPLGVGEAGMPVPTGSDVLQIWDCFKKLGKCAGTTTVDKNNVTVGHWIWVGE